MKRVFIAIDIPDEIKQKIAATLQSHNSGVTGSAIRWVRPENLHLTIRFIGDADDEQVRAICGEVRESAAKFPRFRLALSGTGVFPSASKAKILWLGIKDETNSCSRIKESLETGLQRTAISVDPRRFAPHLTIGRVKDINLARHIITKHLNDDFESADLDVSEIVVYESKLLPDGPVYSRLAGTPLTSYARR